MAFRDQGTPISLTYTDFEWQVLMQIAGGDEKKLRKWLNINMHNVAQKTLSIHPFVECHQCPKQRKSFFVPNHLMQEFHTLSLRYKESPASLINKFITYPAISQHFDVYGY